MQTANVELYNEYNLETQNKVMENSVLFAMSTREVSKTFYCNTEVIYGMKRKTKCT